MENLIINGIEFVPAVQPIEGPQGMMLWPRLDDDGRRLYAIHGGRLGTEQEIRRVMERRR